MSEALHPYYLREMGIPIWNVKKTSAADMMCIMLEKGSDSSAIKEENLLNTMLKSVGFSRDQIYIINPRDTIHTSPKLILALGPSAAQSLLNSSLSLTQLYAEQLSFRQGVHDYHGIPLLISYHPAHLLLNSADKKQAYFDLLHAYQFFNTR